MIHVQPSSHVLLLKGRHVRSSYEVSIIIIAPSVSIINASYIVSIVLSIRVEVMLLLR